MISILLPHIFATLIVGRKYGFTITYYCWEASVLPHFCGQSLSYYINAYGARTIMRSTRRGVFACFNGSLHSLAMSVALTS